MIILLFNNLVYHYPKSNTEFDYERHKVHTVDLAYILGTLKIKLLKSGHFVHLEKLHNNVQQELG